MYDFFPQDLCIAFKEIDKITEKHPNVKSY